MRFGNALVWCWNTPSVSHFLGSNEWRYWYWFVLFQIHGCLPRVVSNQAIANYQTGGRQSFYEHLIIKPWRFLNFLNSLFLIASVDFQCWKHFSFKSSTTFVLVSLLCCPFKLRNRVDLVAVFETEVYSLFVFWMWSVFQWYPTVGDVEMYSFI